MEYNMLCDKCHIVYEKWGESERCDYCNSPMRPIAKEDEYYWARVKGMECPWQVIELVTEVIEEGKDEYERYAYEIGNDARLDIEQWELGDKIETPS